MEYDDPERGREVAARAREFVREEVIPVEREYLGETNVPDDVVADLREKAREYDVYGPQIPEAYGGIGMDFRAMLPVLRKPDAACSVGPRCGVRRRTRGTCTRSSTSGPTSSASGGLGRSRAATRTPGSA